MHKKTYRSCSMLNKKPFMHIHSSTLPCWICQSCCFFLHDVGIFANLLDQLDQLSA